MGRPFRVSERLGFAWGALVLLAVAGFSQAPPFAGGLPFDRNRPAAGTLPESNEAMLLSGRAQEAVQAGDYRLAIQLIEQIMQLPPELVAAPASRTFYPVWRQANRLLAQLPPEAAETYRQMYDAEAQARLRRAAAASDIPALRSLFRRFRLSSAWPDVGRELAAQLLDGGHDGEAVDVLRELLLSADTREPEVRAQLAIALGNVGALRAAEEQIAALAGDAKVAGQPFWTDRIARLKSWIHELRSLPRGESARDTAAGSLSPRLNAADAWGQPLVHGARNFFEDDATIADAVDQLRRLPLQAPVLEAGVLLVRLRQRIWALDALTLSPLWSAAEIVNAGSEVPEAFWGWRSTRSESDDYVYSPDVQALLESPLHHSISAGKGLVFTVEGLLIFDPDGTPLGRVPVRGPGEQPAPNELVARDLRTGRIVWRSGELPDVPFRNAVFQDAPLLLDGRLIAPVQRGEELRLAVLAPDTGHVLREIPIIGPPTYFAHGGGRVRLASDETTLYVVTGNGVIGALARDTLDWRWAMIYPSTLAAHLGRSWWERESEPTESGIDAPVLADELLVAAPVDALEIIAIDRFSGREVWRVPRGEYAFVAGAVSGGLVLGGHQLTCVDLADGESVRWRTVPMEICGRPAVSGELVYVPTRAGIRVVDGRTGKVVADPAASGGPGTEKAPAGWSLVGAHAAGSGIAANLLIGEHALYGCAPSGITMYVDAEATQRVCRRRLEADATDIGARIALAWTEAISNRFEAAMTQLESVKPADPAMAAARSQVLMRSMLGLARAASGGEERLSWLRRAIESADSAETSARLELLIGQVLEQEQRWREAFEHYGRVLLTNQASVVRDENEPDLRISSWMHAATRIRAAWPRLEGNAARETFSAWLTRASTAENAGEMLDRLRRVTDDRALQAEIGRAAALLPLAPELAELFPIQPPADATVELRRRLLLRQWEVHTSLGLLAEAQQDQRAWRETLSNKSPHDASGSDSADLSAMEEQVARIELAQRKLEQTRATPFGSRPARQWRVEGAELILDPRSPFSGPAAWILLRNLRDRRIELHSTVRLPTQQRQTEDGMQRGPAAERAQHDAQVEMAYGMHEVVEPERGLWPAAVFGHLAAVPASGGLVCVGLGPERLGGGRLWEHGIAEWRRAPDTFPSRSATGTEGVLISTRPDRVGLLSWFDGRARWERDLPGARVERILRVADRAIIHTEDQQVISLRFAEGDQVATLPTESGSVRALVRVGDALIVAFEDRIAALDPATLRPRWSSRSGLFGGLSAVRGSGLVAFQARDSGRWTFFDAASGEIQLDMFFPPLGELSALVADERAIYAAGFEEGSLESDVEGLARLAAFERSGGRLLWTQILQTSTPVNDTQLGGHPELIPVLVHQYAAQRDVPNGRLQFDIAMLEKSTGSPIDEPIEVLVERAEHESEMYLLVTPDRIIAQAAGNILAFGNSRLGAP